MTILGYKDFFYILGLMYQFYVDRARTSGLRQADRTIHALGLSDTNMQRTDISYDIIKNQRNLFRNDINPNIIQGLYSRMDYPRTFCLIYPRIFSIWCMFVKNPYGIP